MYFYNFSIGIYCYMHLLVESIHSNFFGIMILSICISFFQGIFYLVFGFDYLNNLSISIECHMIDHLKNNHNILQNILILHIGI